MREALKPRCLPRGLPVSGDGRVTCTLVEALAEPPSCDCEALNRDSLSAEIAAVVHVELEEQRLCNFTGGPACDSLCLCELPQLSGADLDSCQNTLEPLRTTGYCYINAEPGEPHLGNPDLVHHCSSAERRRIRFTGAAPTPDSLVFLACQPPAAP